jgi:hypothetical protein
MLIAEIEAGSPDDEFYEAKVTVLSEEIKHHVKEEEQDWFPKVRAGLGRNQLSELGERLLEAKDLAPRTPAQPSALKKAADAILR